MDEYQKNLVAIVPEDYKFAALFFERIVPISYLNEPAGFPETVLPTIKTPQTRFLIDQVTKYSLRSITQFNQKSGTTFNTEQKNIFAVLAICESLKSMLQKDGINAVPLINKYYAAFEKKGLFPGIDQTDSITFS